MAKKFYFWIAVAWTAVIAVLCLVSFKTLPSVKVADADKYVHATFHFLFTVFWYLHFTNSTPALAKARIRGRVLAFSVIYGCLIEIAQEYLTVTRSADLRDVVANFAGAILAVILLFLYGQFQKTRQV